MIYRLPIVLTVVYAATVTSSTSLPGPIYGERTPIHSKWRSSSIIFYNQKRLSFKHGGKKGPVGKLHNFVVFIRRSPQRREQFSLLTEEGEEDLDLIRDNATRWNSIYKMILRIITVTKRIIAFLFNNSNEKDIRKRLFKKDYLTYKDWHILNETSTILKFFYNQIMRLQSRAKNTSHKTL